MSTLDLIAVTSRSFSKNLNLRKALSQHFNSIKFNETGVRLREQALVDFLSDVKGAIIGLEIIDEELLDKLPNLKAICKMGTGIDKIDLDALKRRNIAFSATPGVNKRSVSELVLALTFTLLRRLQPIYSIIQQGNFLQLPGQLLSNKNVGLIGYGAIGKDLADLLAVFSCQCLVYDLHAQEHFPSHVRPVKLDTLLAESDIISLHIPYDSENKHFIGTEELSRMKKTAILINTARGGLVDEEALYQALKAGYIGGAALDVFEYEPHVPRKLLSLDNFFATSHIGGSTEEAIEAMGKIAIERLLKMGLVD